MDKERLWNRTVGERKGKKKGELHRIGEMKTREKSDANTVPQGVQLVMQHAERPLGSIRRDRAVIPTR